MRRGGVLIPALFSLVGDKGGKKKEKNEEKRMRKRKIL